MPTLANTGPFGAAWTTFASRRGRRPGRCGPTGWPGGSPGIGPPRSSKSAAATASSSGRSGGKSTSRSSASTSAPAQLSMASGVSGRGRGRRPGAGLGREAAVRRRVVRPRRDLGGDPPQRPADRREDPPRGRSGSAGASSPSTTRTSTSPTTASATTPPPGIATGASPWPRSGRSRAPLRVSVLRGRATAVASLRSTHRPETRPARGPPAARRPRGQVVRDSLIVTLGGQLERALGTVTALMLRWGLDPAQLGVYTGLRLYLDNTNRSSLGVGLGAVQEIPILRAAGARTRPGRVADVAHTTNTLTCLAYAAGAAGLGLDSAPRSSPPTRSPPSGPGGWSSVAGLALLKRYESFLIAVLRAHQRVRADDEARRGRVAGLDRRGRPGPLARRGSGGCSGRSGSSVLGQDRLPARPAPAPVPLGLGPPDGAPIDEGRPADPGQHGGLRRGPEPRPGADPLAGPRRRPRGRPLHDRDHGDELEPRPGRADRRGPVYVSSRRPWAGPATRSRWPGRSLRATEAQAPLLAGRQRGRLFTSARPSWAPDAPVRRAASRRSARLLPGMILAAGPGLAGPADADRGRSPVHALALATLVGLAVRRPLAGLIGADRAGIVGVAWGMTIGYAFVALLTGLRRLRPGAWAGGPGRRHQGRLAARVGFTCGTAGTLLTCPCPPACGRWLDVSPRVS